MKPQPPENEILRKMIFRTDRAMARLETLRLQLTDTINFRKHKTNTVKSEEEMHVELRHTVYEIDDEMSKWYTATAPLANEKGLIAKEGREDVKRHAGNCRQG